MNDKEHYKIHYPDPNSLSDDEFTTLCGLSRVEMIANNKMDFLATEYNKITCLQCLAKIVWLERIK